MICLINLLNMRKLIITVGVISIFVVMLYGVAIMMIDRVNTRIDHRIDSLQKSIDSVLYIRKLDSLSHGK